MQRFMQSLFFLLFPGVPRARTEALAEILESNIFVSEFRVSVFASDFFRLNQVGVQVPKVWNADTIGGQTPGDTDVPNTMEFN